MTEKTQREAFWQGAHWAFGRAMLEIVREIDTFPYGDHEEGWPVMNLEAVLNRIASEADEAFENLQKYELEEA